MLKIRAIDAADATNQEIHDNPFKSVPAKFFARVLEVKCILEPIEEKMNATAQKMCFLSHRELMQFEDDELALSGRVFRADAFCQVPASL
jgi:hypothetical protein